MENTAGRSDDEQIRELVSTWRSATKRGDLDALLALVAEDVVFLTPGQAPMSKAGSGCRDALHMDSFRFGS